MVTHSNECDSRSTVRAVVLLAVFLACACSGGKEPTAGNPPVSTAAISVVTGDLQTGVVN